MGDVTPNLDPRPQNVQGDETTTKSINHSKLFNYYTLPSMKIDAVNIWTWLWLRLYAGQKLPEDLLQRMQTWRVLEL